MLPRRHLRQVEPLEPRNLLAGTIQVEVVDHGLVITGDDEANAFGVEAGASDICNRCISVEPDDKTLIEYEGNTYDGQVEIRADIHSVRIEPGKGDDSVRVEGLDLRGSLRIEDSAARGEENTAAVRDVRVGSPRALRGKHIDKSTPLLHHELSIHNSVSTLEDIEIYSGQLRLSSGGHDTAKSIINNMRLAGGGGLDKSTPLLFPAAVLEDTDAEVTNVRADGLLHVQYTRPGGEFQISDAKIGGLVIESSDGLATGHIRDITVVKPIDKSTPLLAPTVTATNVNVEAERLRVDGDISLSFDEAGGSVRVEDLDHDGRLDLVSAGGLDATLQNTRIADAASIQIGPAREPQTLTLAQSKFNGGLEVEIAGPGQALVIEDSVVRKRPGRVKYADITLKRAATIDDADLDKSTPLLMERSIFSGGLVVESNRPLDLDLIDSTVRKVSEIKMEIETIEFRSGGSIDIEGTSFAGGLNVESNLPLDFSMNSSSARRGGYIKIGSIEGELNSDRTAPSESSQISMTDVRFDGGLTVLGGDGGDEMCVEGLQVRGRTRIDLGGGNDRLEAIDSLFAGFTTLDGGSGDTDHLALDNVKLRGRTLIQNWEAE